MFPRARVQVSTRPRPPRIEVPSHSHLSPAPRSATIERSSQPLHSAVLRSPAATLETAGSARAMSTSASYSPSPTAKPPGRTHHQRTVSESGASPQFQVSWRAVLPPYSFEARAGQLLMHVVQMDGVSLRRLIVSNLAAQKAQGNGMPCCVIAIFNMTLIRLRRCGAYAQISYQRRLLRGSPLMGS